MKTLLSASAKYRILYFQYFADSIWSVLFHCDLKELAVLKPLCQ